MQNSLGLSSGLNARKLKNGKDPGEEVDTHAWMNEYKPILLIFVNLDQI